MRASSSAAVLAGSLLIAGIVPAGSVSAATPMVVQSVTTIGTGWSRQIEVRVDGEPGVASIHAALDQGDAAAPYATVDDFTLVSGSVTNGIWRSATAVTLKLGTSRLTATVRTPVAGMELTKVAMVRMLTGSQMTEAAIDEEPVDSDHRKVAYSGRVLYTGPDGTDQPAIGRAYLVVGEFSQVPVTLNGDGRFSGSLILRYGGSAFIRFAPSSLGLRSSISARTQISGPELHKTTFSGITASPNPVGKGARLTVSSRLVRAVDTQQPVTDAPVNLEFSTDQNTWTPVAQGTTDQNGDVAVPVTATQDGFWRLAYAGHESTGSEDGYTGTYNGFEAPDVRYRTAISSFNAGPEPVKKGRTLTVSGVLKRSVDGSAFTAWKGRPVSLYYRLSGSTTWTLAGTATTDTSGRFRKGFKASKDATWKAVFKGDADDLRAESATDYVDVR